MTELFFSGHCRAEYINLGGTRGLELPPFGFPHSRMVVGPERRHIRVGRPSIEVMLSHVAQIDGIFTDQKTHRLPGVQVVLVPNQNRDRADFFKPATSIRPADSTCGDDFDPGVLKPCDLLGNAVDESAKMAIDM